MWTISPPRVCPHTGVIVETATAADSGVAANATVMAAERIFTTISYVLNRRFVHMNLD